MVRYKWHSGLCFLEYCSFENNSKYPRLVGIRRIKRFSSDWPI